MLKKDGTTTLHGKDIVLDATGSVTLKSAGDLVVKSAREVTVKGRKIGPD